MPREYDLQQVSKQLFLAWCPIHGSLGNILSEDAAQISQTHGETCEQQVTFLPQQPVPYVPVGGSAIPLGRNVR